MDELKIWETGVEHYQSTHVEMAFYDGIHYIYINVDLLYAEVTRLLIFASRLSCILM